jgi:spermidine/putrescine transport system substrate-binding protein
MMVKLKTRRSLGGLVAIGLSGVLTLSACGGETTVDNGAAEETTAVEAAPSEETAAEGDGSEAASSDFPAPNGGELNLYNWTDYISPDLLKRFEAETGITVNLDNFDSNETMLSKLQAGGANYDVVVPSDYMVAQMIDLGLLQEVDPAAFPNGSFIKPEFMDVYFDPGRKYSAPYMYGTTGIAYDPTKAGGEIDSWVDFFDADSPAAGKIGTLNDQVELVHAALRAVGAEPCSVNRDDYVKVEKLLLDWKPNVAVINSDGVIGRMASGEQTVHMMWNGAFTRAQADNANLEYVYPSEGLNLWSDNFAVPVGAQNVDNAKIFINWMMDPKNIGEATNFVGYDNGITGSGEFMLPELSASDAVIIPEEFKTLAAPVPGCSVEAIDLYDAVFTSFKK